MRSTVLWLLVRKERELRHTEEGRVNMKVKHGIAWPPKPTTKPPTTEAPMSEQKTKHTPGPWQTHHSVDATGYPCFFIHGISSSQKRDTEVLDANAKLIAAAPALLAACKGAMAFVGGAKQGCACEGCVVRRELANVIAQAEGAEQ
jgi:hypothetical protein